MSSGVSVNMSDYLITHLHAHKSHILMFNIMEHLKLDLCSNLST